MKQVVSIHGAPRSGTSWLGQLADSSENVRYKFQPLFSYMYKDFVTMKSDQNEWMTFFHRLYNTEDIFLDQLDKKMKKTYPKFDEKKEYPTHLVMKMVRYHYLIPRILEFFDDIKVIGIVRNPCSVMNSWRKAPREFLKDWNFDEEWYFADSKNKFKPEEYYGFNRWKELSNLFLYMEEIYPENFKLVQYEDLVNCTEEVVRDIFEFIDLDYNKQTERFITESKTKYNNDTYSVYKGGKNLREWEYELPKHIIDKIYSELKDTKMERFLV